MTFNVAARKKKFDTTYERPAAVSNGHSNSSPILIGLRAPCGPRGPSSTFDVSGGLMGECFEGEALLTAVEKRFSRISDKDEPATVQRQKILDFSSAKITLLCLAVSLADARVSRTLDGAQTECRDGRASFSIVQTAPFRDQNSPCRPGFQHCGHCLAPVQAI